MPGEANRGALSGKEKSGGRRAVHRRALTHPLRLRPSDAASAIEIGGLTAQLN
jgi:hypothetical protein